MKTFFCYMTKADHLSRGLQNVAGSKLTRRPSEGTHGCNCDRWGHPSPDCVEHNVQVQPEVIDFSTCQRMR